MADNLSKKRKDLTKVRNKSWLGRVAKSFGYAMKDNLKEWNPVITNMVSQTKDVSSDIYQKIQDFKSPDGGSSSGDIFKTARSTVSDVIKNALDDIKTGNLYNIDRQNSLENDAMKALMGDMGDFDFDDDWGDMDFDDDDSADLLGDKAVIANDNKNTAITISSMDKVGKKVSNAVSTATVLSAEAIIEANRQQSKALFDLNKSGFASINEGIINLNNSIVGFAQIGKSLTDHMQNSTTFFTKTTDILSNMNQTLEKIAKNTEPAPLSQEKKASTVKHSFTDVFSSDGISINAFKDMIVDNFKDNKDLLGMGLDMIKGLKSESGSYGKNISIMTMVTKTITGVLIPKILKDSMASLNEEIKYISAGGLMKLSKAGKGGMITEILKDIFLPKDGYKSNINNANYEKGRVSFDGITKKAITDVIPISLMKIYAALTGTPEMRFDYNAGKFVPYRELNRIRTQDKERYIQRAGDDYRKDALNKIKESGASGEEQARLAKEVESYFRQAFETADNFWKIKEKDFTEKYQNFGLSKDSQKILVDLLREYQGSKEVDKRHRANKFFYDLMESRKSYGDFMRRNEASGNSIYQYLNDGWGEEAHNAGVRKGGMFFDEFGHNNLYYLREILNAVQNLEVDSGKGKRGRRRYGRRSAMREHTTQQSNAQLGLSNAGASEDIYLTEEEKAAKEKQKKFEEEMKNIRDNVHGGVKNFFGIEDVEDEVAEETGFKGKLKSIINKPAQAISNFITALTYSMDSIIWGKEGDDRKKGIVGYILNKAEGMMDKIFEKAFGEGSTFRGKMDEWAEKLFGTKEEIVDPITGKKKTRRKGGFFSDLFNDTADHLKQAKDWFVEPFTSGSGSGLLSYYYGGESKVSKKIERQMKEKEAREKKMQQWQENREKQQKAAKDRIRKKFSETKEGRQKLRDAGHKVTFKGEATDFIDESMDRLKSGVSSVFSRLFGDPDKSEEEAKLETEVMKEVSKKALSEIGDNKGAVAAGAIIGGGVSILTGALVGPLFGAAIGGAVGLAVKSQTVQKLLFGDDEGNKGLLSEKMQEFIKKELPNTARGAGLGLAGGLFLGSPLLGAVIGGTIGYVKSSERAKTFLFGEQITEINEKGKKVKSRVGGVLPKSLQKKILGTAPSIFAGMGISSMASLMGLGPFGLVGNMIIGGGLGYLSTSEKFQNWLLGKKDEHGKRQGGFLWDIREKILGNVTDLFANLGLRMKGFLKNLVIGISEKVFLGIKGLAKKAKEGKGPFGFLKPLYSAGEFLTTKLLGGTVGALGGFLNRRKRKNQEKNLKRGYDVYGTTYDENGKKVKKILSASERLKLAKEKSSYAGKKVLGLSMRGENSLYGKYDTLLAGMQSKEDLDELSALLDNANRFGQSKEDQEAANEALSKYFTSKGIKDAKFSKTDTRKMRDLLKTEYKDKRFSKEGQEQTFRNNLFDIAKTLNINVAEIAKRLGLEPAGDSDTISKANKANKDAEKQDEKESKKDQNKDGHNGPDAGGGVTNTGGISGNIGDSPISEGASVAASEVKNNLSDGESLLANNDGNDDGSGFNPGNSSGGIVNTIKNFGNKVKNGAKNAGNGILNFGKKVSGVFSKLPKGVSGFFKNLGNLAPMFATDLQFDAVRRSANPGLTGAGSGLVPYGFLYGGDSGDLQPEDSTSKTILNPISGMPEKFILSRDGDLEKDKSDSSTKESMEMTKNFHHAIGKIPLLGSLVGMFSKFKDKLLGNDDGEGKGGTGLLGRIGGMISTLASNSVSLIGNLLSGLKSSFPLLLTGLVMSGAADKAAEEATDGAYGHDSSTGGSVTEAIAIVTDPKTGKKKKVKVHKNENGEWVLEDGTLLEERYPENEIDNSTITSRKGSNTSLSSKTNSGMVRQVVTGQGKNTLLYKAASKSKPVKAVAGAVKNLGTKVGNSNIGKTISKNFKYGKNGGKGLTKILAKDSVKSIEKALMKLPEIAKKIPGLKNPKIIAALESFAEAAGKKFGPLLAKGAQSAGKLAASIERAVPILNIAFLIADFTTGYEDARNTLRIKEPTKGQRLLCGILRLVKNLVPVIGVVIPDTLVVDLLVKYVGPAIGLSMKKLKNDREEFQAEIDAYNERNGTNMKTGEYIKTVMKDYTWTERVGNAASTVVEQTKAKVEDFKNKVDEKGIGGALVDVGKNIASDFNDGFTRDGLLGGLSNAIKGFLPGIIGEIPSKILKIFSAGIKGDVSKVWDIGLSDFSADSSDPNQVAPSIISKLVGTIPLLPAKLGATLIGVVSTGVQHIAGFIKDKIIDPIAPFFISLGEDIASLGGNVIKGDPEELMRSNSKVNTGIGFLDTIFSVIHQVVKIPLVPISITSWAVQGIFNFLKDNIVIPAANGLGSFLSNFGSNALTILSGEGVGEIWSTGTEFVDNAGIFSPIVNVANILQNVLLTGPALITWAGGKVLGFLKDNVVIPAANGLGSFLSNFGSNALTILTGGGVKELWSTGTEFVDNAGIFSPIVNVANILQNVLLTGPALITWAGGKVLGFLKDNVVAPAINTIAGTYKTVGLNFKKGVLDGDVVGLWKNESQTEDGGVFGWITPVISTVNKVMLTIPSAISWVGHRIGDAISSLFAPFKGDIEKKNKFDTNIDKYNNDVLKIWSEPIPKYDTPLSGIFTAVSWVSKIFKGIIAIITTVVDTISKPFKKAINVVGDFVGGIKDFFTGGSSDLVIPEDATFDAQGARDAIEKKANENAGSGSKLRRLSGGASFISQRDSRYAGRTFGGANVAEQGCGPAVAAMASGTSMNNAINKSARYQNAGGTTMDYFIDQYGAKPVNGAQVVDALTGAGSVALLGQDSTNDSKANSPFGPNPHYVLATGMDSNGNIMVNDPENRGPMMYPGSILNNVKGAVEFSGSGSGIYSWFTGAGKKGKKKSSSLGMPTSVQNSIKKSSSLGMPTSVQNSIKKSSSNGDGLVFVLPAGTGVEMGYQAQDSLGYNAGKIIKASTINSDGFRMVNGRYCISLTPYLASRGTLSYRGDRSGTKKWTGGDPDLNGRYFDAVLSDGTIIPGIVTDIKGKDNDQGGNSDYGHHMGKQTLEFVKTKKVKWNDNPGYSTFVKEHPNYKAWNSGKYEPKKVKEIVVSSKNWFKDKNVSASAISGSSTANGTSQSATPTFPSYKLNDTQIKGLANIIAHEQGGKEGMYAEASQMANLTDKSGDSKATPANIVAKATGGWYAHGKERYNQGTNNATAIQAVKDVIVNGKRTLPRYVDEHDYVGDIASVTVGNKSIGAKDYDKYVAHNTVIKNKMGSTYKFFTFPGKPGTVDPFGYTSDSLRKKYGDARFNVDGTPIGGAVSGTDTVMADGTNSGSSTSSTDNSSGGYLSLISSAFTSAFDKAFGKQESQSSASTTTDASSSDNSNLPAGSATDVNGLLNIARNELDYQEKRSNSDLDDKHKNVGSANYTKYGKFTGTNGAPWCASFVSWDFNQAFGTDKAKKVLRGPFSAAVDGLWSNFKKANAMTKTPQPGDVIIYKNGTSHTGLVEAVDTTNKTYDSIEGNTSGGNNGFSRDGGIVARKKGRPWNYPKVTGFGRPDWSALGGSGSGLQPSSFKSLGQLSGAGSGLKRNNSAVLSEIPNTSDMAKLIKALLYYVMSLTSDVESIKKNSDFLKKIFNLITKNGKGKEKETSKKNSKKSQELDPDFVNILNTLNSLAKG